MTRILVKAALLLVVTAAQLSQGAARGLHSLRQDGPSGPAAIGQCPQVFIAIACMRPASTSCRSSSDCRDGDECCRSVCGRDCYNPDTGYYKGQLAACPPVNPYIYCFWFNEQCSEEAPCAEGEICCGNNCGTFCYATQEESESTTPEEPESTTPEEPESATPEESEITPPEEPESTTPEEPESATPEESEATEPTQPPPSDQEE